MPMPPLNEPNGSPMNPWRYIPTPNIPRGVVHSNFGGLGPDNFAGSEPNIVIRHLGTTEGGIKFDMIISNTTALYASAYSKFNNVWSPFGYLTMAIDSQMDMKFSIVETGTKIPLVLSKFYFSFFDLDAGDDTMGAAESVSIGGFESYLVPADSELAIGTNGRGQTTFAATVVGSSADNPDDPMNLNVQQENRAVTLKFVNTAEFEATYMVAAAPNSNPSGRDVFFSGKSKLATNPCATPTPTPVIPS